MRPPCCDNENYKKRICRIIKKESDLNTGRKGFRGHFRKTSDRKQRSKSKEQILQEKIAN